MNIVEMIVLSLAISLDSLVSAFGYGMSKIKIPFSSCFSMAFMGTCILAVSSMIGYLLGNILNGKICKYISCGLLLAVGIFKFLSEIFKIYLNKKIGCKKKVKIKLFNKQMNLDIYIDCTKADKDQNKILSVRESLGLGLLLSIDSIGVGISTGITKPYAYPLIIFSFVFSVFAIYAGSFIGKKIGDKIKLNLSWLSGLTLIILSVFKFL